MPKRTSTDPSQRRNYPLNQWWVAAFSDELDGGRPLARRLLEKPIVLYRRADGLPAALDDRCPHRWTPLSMGCVKGNDIVCGYHGFRFKPSGEFVEIPTQAVAPRGTVVRSYPVLERPPFVWIWMGDGAVAQAPEPPDLPWLVDPGWSVIKDLVPLKAHYMSLRENVLDLTHFGYAHASTFQITDWDRPPEVSTDGTTVSFIQRFDGSPLAEFYAVPSGIDTGHPTDRIEWGRFVSPAIHVSGVDITPPGPEHQRDDGQPYSLRFTHVTTPESSTRTHYFWTVARNHGREPEAIAALARSVAAAFDEDRVILEAIQRQIDESPDSDSWREISVKADRAALTARRILAKVLAGEARADGSNPAVSSQ